MRNLKLWNAMFVVLLFSPNSLMTVFQLLLRINLYNTQLGYILIIGTAIDVGPILMAAYVRSIPVELDEATAVDGIGYWCCLLTFVIPLAKPALATVFILQAIGVWNDIILATILLPDQAKSPISLMAESRIGVARLIRQSGESSDAAASSPATAGLPAGTASLPGVPGLSAAPEQGSAV